MPVPQVDADVDLLDRLVLQRADPSQPGWTRRKRGKGFSYHDHAGRLLQGADRDRCASLVLPPAWSSIWICAEPEGHLQASGIDAADRRQYRYHEHWVEGRHLMNLDRLANVGKRLGPVRRRLDELLTDEDDPVRRATAAMIRMVDAGLARIGGSRSAREFGHYGVSTLRRKHVELGPDEIVLRFPGKSGVLQQVVVDDPLLAEVLGELELGSDHLFVIRGEDRSHRLTAADANELLAELSGATLTCKDFRTWGGTAVALEARATGASEIEAVDAVAAALGNTRAVARSSYVHPEVLAEDLGPVVDAWRGARASIRYDRRERALLRLLDATPSLFDRWVEEVGGAGNG
ncbi:DNA topoisomerase IB [soil metagenome]